MAGQPTGCSGRLLGRRSAALVECDTPSIAALADRWSLNIHYDRLIVDAVPKGAMSALDVGCGDGLLSFGLADKGLEVVGIDTHAPVIERARASAGSGRGPTFLCADVFTHDFDAASFDVVVSNAMLHHVDVVEGLRRLRELVRPGGAIIIVGFARIDRPRDLVLAVAGRAAKRFHMTRGRYWEHNAPICWPPAITMSEMRALGTRELPDSTFRRAMSSRYILEWQAPG